MSTDAFAAISFRDPAGFVYSEHGEIRRQINRIYAPEYDHLMSSGLFDELVEARLLIPHQEVDCSSRQSEFAYKVIRPERVEFISYMYEWCFSQLKDAAILTLDIQRRVLAKGMSLKDCSAYNVQFHRGRPIFVDTLSFELIKPGQPWTAYRQFCQHFLAPLALMSLADVRLNQLTRAYIDGIPLDLIGRLLPWTCRLRWGILLHLLLHGRFEAQAVETSAEPAARPKSISEHGQTALIENLLSTVHSLKSPVAKGTWATYYADHTYSTQEFKKKEDLVGQFLSLTQAGTAWDLGANTGRFSRLAASQGISTVSFDADHSCVEMNYLDARTQEERRLLPLYLDLFNPTPASGWMTKERTSVFERSSPDVVMALALIHHLAVVGNQPLANLAQFFQSLSSWLVIEFVPETDAQFLRLIRQRQGIHHAYNRTLFEQCFSQHFQILQSEPLTQSGRILYLMRRLAA